MKLKKIKKLKNETSDTSLPEKKDGENIAAEETKKVEVEKKDAGEIKKGDIAETISDDILEMIESSDAPAKEPEETHSEDEIECPECGEKLPLGTKSCLNCGTLIEIEEIEIPIEEAKTKPSVADEEHIDISVPVQQLLPPTSQKSSEDDKDKKSREKLKWMIEECKKRGYDVSSIEPSLDSQELISLSKRVVSFLNSVRLLGEIEADIDVNIATGKFDENDPKVKSLRAKLKKPDLIDEVKGEYSAILSASNTSKVQLSKVQMAEVPIKPEVEKIKLVEVEEIQKEKIEKAVEKEILKIREPQTGASMEKIEKKEVKEVKPDIRPTKTIPTPTKKEKEIVKPKPIEVVSARKRTESGEVLVEEEQFACPFCGTIVGSNEVKCTHCHAEFEEEMYQCGFCGAIIEKDAVECDACGSYLGNDETVCPVCDLVTNPTTPRCPRCGTEFVSDAILCASCGIKLTETNVPKCPNCGAVLKEEITVRHEGTVIFKAEEKKEKEEIEPTNEQRVKRVLFPFSAIVSQENMKMALLLNAVNPEIGGVLIEGEKGTAKSVTVRGLAEVLPPIKVVKGCRFSCDPDEPEKFCWECRVKYKDKGVEPPVDTRPIKVVDLPLNATEDRVVGTIDLEKILTHGLRAFEHGILAEANRGILYIDEINLLDDYVVDVLLDAAAMGVCTVERESVSVSYPAKFIIVGSMNPEEGALRPQLLDRIALQVKIKGVQNVEDRIEIVKRREEFNRDPEGFRKKFDAQQEEIRQKIIKARALLPQVSISREILQTIAKVSVAFGVDGHRADIIMERAAKAHAALNGRLSVNLDDVMKAAEFTLPHRMRKRPFEEEEFSLDKLKRVIEQNR